MTSGTKTEWHPMRCRNCGLTIRERRQDGDAFLIHASSYSRQCELYAELLDGVLNQ